MDMWDWRETGQTLLYIFLHLTCYSVHYSVIKVTVEELLTSLSQITGIFTYILKYWVPESHIFIVLLSNA